ncbi:hypothetical protein GCM10023172_27310 [Hymenobacter ginsengisoli]|uniref:DUF4174 domain-containing protein n=1 Tax=Hymenobacter ginsengisoli TaxID=1051626 RepID=A0ABP8QGN2_9BACT|nr:MULTISPECIES: DUF4174 domain-containing protein [unclassified Hymenobacter]MBO2030014.1 DUF4174 domain-containing protein [Hymenobacter sp. BT559]
MACTKSILCGLLALATGPLLAAQATAPPGLAERLRASRWQHRVLLIGAPTAAQAEFQRQKRLLAADAAGLAARDMTIMEVFYDQLSPADRQCWTQQLGQPLAGFRVVLIGKDGGVKRTETQPLAPASLFGIVDKMPMRRQEMWSRKTQ